MRLLISPLNNLRIVPLLMNIYRLKIILKCILDCYGIFSPFGAKKPGKYSKVQYLRPSSIVYRTPVIKESRMAQNIPKNRWKNVSGWYFALLQMENAMFTPFTVAEPLFVLLFPALPLAISPCLVLFLFYSATISFLSIPSRRIIPSFCRPLILPLSTLISTNSTKGLAFLTSPCDQSRNLSKGQKNVLFPFQLIKFPRNSVVFI